MDPDWMDERRLFSSFAHSTFNGIKVYWKLQMLFSTVKNAIKMKMILPLLNQW